MPNSNRYPPAWIIGFLLVVFLHVSIGCRPSDVLDVPPPSGEYAYSGVTGQTAVEQVFEGARGQFFHAVSSSGSTALMEFAGLLSDELTVNSNMAGTGRVEELGYIDARHTVYSPNLSLTERGDIALESVLQAREALLVSLPNLREYEPSSSESTIGEAYALIGYAELMLAEDFCAGVTLSNIVPGGGWSYGMALSSDSLLSTAEAHFDSAIANAHGNNSIMALASIGLGRTRLDRGNFAQADSAVVNVAANYVYNVQLEPTDADDIGSLNMWTNDYNDCGFFNIADQEGGNGLRFRTAQDPRLVLDSTFEETCDGRYRHFADSIEYLPLKFFNGLPSSYASSGLIPLATGVEAQLIIAEAALQANQPAVWLTTLNTLRNSGCGNAADASCAFGSGQVVAQSSGLQPLTDPGSDTARASVMFQERAFWLFGTGTRLGDMRRLIRQYHRDPNAVFPTGSYEGGTVAGLPSYGTDVALTLPTPQSGYTTPNPNYKGCLTPTSTA